MKRRHIVAVVAIGDEVLLEYRKTGSTAGLLMLPGGGSEGSEEPFETLVREMREELHITVHDAEWVPFESPPRTNNGTEIGVFVVRQWSGVVPTFNWDDGSPIVWGSLRHLEDHPLGSMRQIAAAVSL